MSPSFWFVDAHGGDIRQLKLFTESLPRSLTDFVRNRRRVVAATSRLPASTSASYGKLEVRSRKSEVMQCAATATKIASFTVADFAALYLFEHSISERPYKNEHCINKSRYILGISVKNRGENFVYSCQNPLPKRFLAVYRQFFNCRQCSRSLVALQPHVRAVIVALQPYCRQGMVAV